MNRGFEFLILNLFPKRLFTSLLGSFAKSSLSRFFIPTFIRYYDIDCTEAEFDVHEYGSLQQFFCRRLKKGVREISTSGIAAPVDGRISELGKIMEGTLLQAKGSTYRLEDLLLDPLDANRYLGGTYITIYLSPQNYHRIHMPFDGICVKWLHAPGRLFPVNPMGVRSISGLFTKNERAITHIRSGTHQFCIVKIGAAGVGSVRADYLPVYSIYKHRLKLEQGELCLPHKRGEEVGWFEFGSTVILVFEPGFVKSFTVETGDFVRMGMQIAAVD
jgi:phosphatidylserine decarboxylase